MEVHLYAVFAVIVAFLLKGLLSLTEAAFFSCRKTRLLAQAEAGNKKYGKVLKTLENPARVLAAFRISNIFLIILSGAAGGFAFSYILKTAFGILIILLTALTTFVIIVLSDIIPQEIALIAPEKISANLLPFINALVFLSMPLIALSALITNIFIRILRFEKDAPKGMTEGELRIALIEGEKSGIVESNERSMVEKVFYLGDKPVGTFMTHRSEIVWLDINSDRESIKKSVIEHKEQSYFPVADGNLDAVIGVVSLESILIDENHSSLKTLMNSPTFIPETMSALKAFEVFKKANAEFLLVMDEYGGFAGVLSVQNLLSAIVGQSEQEEDPIVKQDDGTYLADGSINIDDVAEILSVNIVPVERQEYHTLAGFIFSLAGEIPQKGERFEYRGYEFMIADMDGNRIHKVLISPLK